MQCTGVDKNDLELCNSLVQFQSKPIDHITPKTLGRPRTYDSKQKWEKPKLPHCGRPYKKLQGFQHKYGTMGNKRASMSQTSPVRRKKHIQKSWCLAYT